jgi:tetratricopeptide (TPR) repeat protein
MEITIQQAVTAHQEGRLEEAERLYRSILENQPTDLDVNNNLGVLLYALGRFNEAEASYKKAIELKPDSEEVYSNLGVVLKNLGRFDEAVASYKKAIELKPDYVGANNNLVILLKQKKLLSKLEQVKKSKVKTKINFLKKAPKRLLGSDLRLCSNPFISSLKVETELIRQLYKINSNKLDDVLPKTLHYGNGKTSDYQLFENDFSTIKTVERDLVNIIKEAVKSDIFIMESFFNIFRKGSGIIFHNHVLNFDKTQGLVNQKYSLTYYLDIGDQTCSEPGILKLQDPNKEILPSEGMIVIFPASRMHSAVYNGEKDRVMIGANFYSLT